MSTLASVLTFEESGQFAAKSKTSANYWLSGKRLFKFTRKNSSGATVTDADFSCQLSFGGRRERFQLHTANKAEAASKAASIYRDVVGKGWEDMLRIHKPKALPKVETLPPATVGSQRRVLVIEDNEHKRLKSKDSAGDIDLEPEICALFQGYRATAQSPFVLESSKRIRRAAMMDRETRGYRCEPTHQSLLAWLRGQGVKGIRPMHALRKEIGAVIASRDGIWKAPRYLRHSDIRITSKLYADKKIPVASGLASFLAPAADNVVAADFGPEKSKPQAVPDKRPVRRRA